MTASQFTRRSTDICAECRARKIRCDGQQDGCGNCARLESSCSFQRNEDVDVQPLLQRQRVRLACVACRSLKARCGGQLPGCRRCHLKGIECVYKPSKRASTNASKSTTSIHELPATMTALPEGTVSALGGHTSPVADAPRSHTLSPEVEIHHPSGASDTASTRLHVPVSDCDLHGSAVMNEEIVMQAFDNFFRHLRPIPAFSFLHKASLLQRYQAGLVDRSMILAVIGIVTAMTDFPAVSKECGARCIQEAERLVISDFGSPSVLKTQVLVLIIKYYAWQREHSKSFMLLATASRFAYAMKLNYEAPDLSFVAQESRRRLMWSIYVLDTIFGSGVRELTLCPDETLLIQLPCHERNFDFDLPQVTEPLKLMSHQPLSDNVGFVGLYVRIMNLRSKILRATKNAVVSQNHEQVPALVEGLKSELDTFMARVPASLHFSSKSLHLHAHSSDLCPFLLVHLWWRQCYCDLYRVTLRGLREALPCAALDQLGPEFVIYCQFQCFEAAKALSAVFRSSLALKVTLPVMGSEIYACAYQCVRLLFYAYRHYGASLSLSVESVTDHAMQCLLLLRRLPAISPAAVQIVSLPLDGFLNQLT